MDVIFLQFMSTDDGLLLMIVKFACSQVVVLIKSSETLIGFRATHNKGGWEIWCYKGDFWRKWKQGFDKGGESKTTTGKSWWLELQAGRNVA